MMEKLVLPVRQVQLAPQAHRALRVPEEIEVQLVMQVMLVHKVNKEAVVLLDQEDGVVRLANRELLVSLVIKVKEDHPGRSVRQDNLVKWDHRDRKVEKVQLGVTVNSVLMVNPVPVVLLELLGQWVSGVLLDQREILDFLDLPVPKVKQEVKGILEGSAPLVPLVFVAQSGKWACVVQRDREVNQVKMALAVKTVILVIWDLWVRQVQEARILYKEPACNNYKVPKAKKDNLAIQDLVVVQAFQVLLVILAPLVMLVNLEKMAQSVLMDLVVETVRMGVQDVKAKQANQVHVEPLVCKALLEKQVIPETLDLQAPLAFPDHLVSLDYLDWMV